MGRIPSIDLKGDVYQRGASHGEAFTDEIGHNIGFYLDYFQKKNISETEARSYAKNAIELVEGKKSDFIEEMKGVAEGSQSSLEHIALINFRHTILYSAYAKSEPDGCTGFGIEPEYTEEGKTYIGQNWDWKTGVKKLIMKVRSSNHPDFMALTEAGNVGGKFGLNEEGIGFTVNGLNALGDGRNPDRVPSHVRGREILESERLDQGIEAVIETLRPTSRNYILARAEGEIINMETTTDDSFFHYPEEGVLTHTNHFESLGVKSILERKVPHSVTRKARIRRLFDKAELPYSEQDIKRILRDHVGRPKSICRHSNRREMGSRTKASIIMDLEERKMVAADGPPCEDDYFEYKL